MADDKGQVTTPSPEQDIIEGLFGDPKDTTTQTTPNTTVDNKPDKSVDNKDTKDGKDDKVDVDAIVERAVSRAVEKIQPLINQSANSLTRQQQLNTWFASEDGKMFLQHKQFIERAANDPRFSSLRIDQLPAAVLKPSSYAKLLTDAKEAADRAAKDGITGGTSGGRPQETKGTEPDYGKMSREDFQKVLKENQAKMVRR